MVALYQERPETDVHHLMDARALASCQGCVSSGLTGTSQCERSNTTRRACPLQDGCSTASANERRQRLNFVQPRTAHQEENIAMTIWTCAARLSRAIQTTALTRCILAVAI